MSADGGKAKAKPYRRLPGKASGLFQSQTLWLASDHLLLVTSVRFMERYQRVYLKDIQSIITREKPGERSTLKIAALLTALVSLAIVFLLPSASLWLALFVPLSIVSLGAFLSEMLNGDQCECYVTTAINTYQLRPLHDLKVARRVQEQLRPLILAAQADLINAPAEPSAATLI